MFIGTRNGNVTTEKITWVSTLMGALAFTGAQMALRAIAIGLVMAMALLVGRGTGPILWGAVLLEAISVDLRRLWPPEITVRARLVKKRRRRHLLLLTAAACLFTAAWIFNLWPALWWAVGDGRLWLATARASRSLPPLLLWLRVAMILGFPWAVTRPGVNLDWVLDIETRWPKAREVGFTPADIASPAVRDPRARLRRAATRGGDAGSWVAPASGNLQEANPPNSGIAMKVDGV